jgi:hypothetical protein
MKIGFGKSDYSRRVDGNIMKNVTHFFCKFTIEFTGPICGPTYSMVDLSISCIGMKKR